LFGESGPDPAREQEAGWILVADKQSAKVFAAASRRVVLAVSDDHAGLKRAIAEVLPEAFWQRCYVHFLRNALDYLPRKAADDCLTELRWFYERRNVEEARRDLIAWLGKWQAKYPKLCEWVESNIEQTFTFYRLPKEHHKHLKSTNLVGLRPVAQIQTSTCLQCATYPVLR
jgi:transposase-like protein